jgi:membrane-associated phospholipid phosphatase
LLADRIVTLIAWLKALTQFGDTAVLLPLATVMLLWLFLTHSARSTVWWAIAAVFCAGLTAILKVFFYGCPPIPNLHSPSGHTSFSALVYGGMALVSATEGPGLRRILTISGGAGFILAIAVSRLLLYVHNGAEVGLGLVIGLSSLAVFGHEYLPCPVARVRLSPLFIASGAVVLALHGRVLHVELFFQKIAGYLHLYCV